MFRNKLCNIPYDFSDNLRALKAHATSWSWVDLKGAIATQSSDHGGNLASRAIDGNAGCARTANKANAWWQVDLGKQLPIHAVKITSKERLKGFTVRVNGAACATDKNIGQGKIR